MRIAGKADPARRLPPYLFSPRNDIWTKLSDRMKSASSLAVFLDYDGTLTQIRPKPMAAILEPETAGLLKELTKLPGVRVSIITGRSMPVIRRLVRIENIGIAASHGFHIVQDDSEWIHPDVRKFSKKLTQLQSMLRHSLHEIPEAILERKQGTLTVHYRNVSSRQVDVLRSITSGMVRAIDPKYRIYQGKKILEIRPPIQWGKGEAVIKMLKMDGGRNRPLVLFVGDDSTDEDAFRSLRTKAISVRVGKSSLTKARFYVKNVGDVHRLLRSILMLRTGATRGVHDSALK